MCIDADDPDRHRAAHVAKAAAGRAATHCAKDGMQIHGGIGYTWEHDLHLYIRRAYASEHLLRYRRLAPRPPRRPDPRVTSLASAARDAARRTLAGSRET